MFELRKLNGQAPKSSDQLAKEKGFALGITGDPDAGKTSTIHSLMTDESMYPVCVLNCDGGAHVIKNEYTTDGRIQIYNIASWPDAEQKAAELLSNPAPFKSIWCDVVNIFGDMAIDYHGVHEVQRNDARGRQQTYGESNWDTVLFHRKFIDLAVAKGINMFFVYWSSEPIIQEGSGSIAKKKHLLMSPSLAKKVIGVLDIVIYLEKQQGLVQYPPTATLYGNQGVETRMRLAPDNPLKKWPPTVKDINLAAMVRGFHGEPYDPKTASMETAMT